MGWSHFRDVKNEITHTRFTPFFPLLSFPVNLSPPANRFVQTKLSNRRRVLEYYSYIGVTTDILYRIYTFGFRFLVIMCFRSTAQATTRTLTPACLPKNSYLLPFERFLATWKAHLHANMRRFVILRLPSRNSLLIYVYFCLECANVIWLGDIPIERRTGGYQ